MRPNKLLRALSLCVACLLLGACAGASAASPRKVALVVKSTQSQFFLSVFAGAEAAAAEYNLELTITGPDSEEDYETQNQLVAQAVADGAQVVIFSATDFSNTAPAIDEAARQGVGIVAIDSGVDSQAVATYIGTDNYAAGAMAAQAALSLDEGELRVGIVNYGLNSANGQQRESGARDALEESGRASIVAVVNTKAQADSARDDTVAMLRDNPDINVLLAFNEPTSVGAAEAVGQLGLADRVHLVGFDANVKAVDALQTGEVDALIVQNPYAMGYLGVESAYKLLTGRQSELPVTLDTATRIVNRDNLFTMDSQKALFAFG